MSENKYYSLDTEYYLVLARKDRDSDPIYIPDDLLIYPPGKSLGGYIPDGSHIQIGSILWMLIWINYDEEPDGPAWYKTRFWRVKNILVLPRYKYILVEPHRDKTLYSLEKEEIIDHDQIDNRVLKSLTERYGEDCLGTPPELD